MKTVSKLFLHPGGVGLDGPEPGGQILDVEGLSVKDDKGLIAIKNVSFSICKGEILGIAGVSGNGQKELEETLVGLRKTFEGKIFVKGRDVTNKSTREILSAGVGLIPEDRIGKGIAGTLSVAENLILGAHTYSPFAHRGSLPFDNKWFIDKRSSDEYADRLIKEFDIRTPSREAPALTLSGGNLQKLILAREISRNPDILIVSQPTRGLDVAATEFIRKRLLRQKEQGTAILLISEDLNEIISLSDRVAVIYRGEILGIIPSDQVDVKEIGLMMAGVKR
ncbi:MAG: ATP-binding cassette domain-containing protein [Candidatus Bathyarchaeia archaeon]